MESKYYALVIVVLGVANDWYHILPYFIKTGLRLKY